MRAVVDPNGPKLVDIEANPVPEGARVGYFKTSDNVRLRYAIWQRSGGPNRGTICLLQGRTEFIEKYFETIEDLRRRGFAVATFDWRGQGGSDRLISNRRWGFVERYEDYWTDLKSFHADILLPDCPPPFNLVAHSMGGMVALFAAARDRMMFDRMLLCSPMVSVDTQFSAATMATLLEFGCFVGLGQFPLPGDFKTPSEAEFPGNEVTSDFERYMRSAHVLKAEPSLVVNNPSIRWGAATARAVARVAQPDFPNRINVPILMLAAARDKVVSTPAIEHLGVRLRTGRHAVIAKARHEMLMEADEIREQVLAAFDVFIMEQSR